MGNCFSFKQPSSPFFDTIRLVHLTGFIEDFQDPITVKKIQVNHPKHCVCTMAHLLPNSSKFPPDTQLQPGKLHFLLPISLFQSETSAANIVAIGTRLTVLANRRKPTSKGSIASNDHKLGVKVYAEMKSSEKGSWKPILDLIVEKSMEHRSEPYLISNFSR